jgi:biopolymer transport protein ExbB/TolQ
MRRGKGRSGNLDKFLLLIIFITVLLLSACQSDKDYLEEELDKYKDDMKSLAQLETNAVNAYDNVIGENYKDDYTTFAVIEGEVIPKYRKFIDELEKIKPEHEKVRNLHEIYIEAANNQLNAFVTILAAIEQQDYELVTEANKGLESARKLIRDWEYELKSLEKEVE